MNKTAPALKWLAEKRARVVGRLPTAERSAVELTRRAANITARAAAARARLVSLRSDLSGLDRALKLYSAAIDPSTIAPVRPRDSYEGQDRGLRRCIAEFIESRLFEGVTTEALMDHVINTFALDFELPGLRRRWSRNSFKGAIKKLVRDGFIEPTHDPAALTNKAGGWRWKVEKPRRLADLAMYGPRRTTVQ
ncbi:MAG: hypothetical protein ABIZ18_07035 [Caldimonas sp.]